MGLTHNLTRERFIKRIKSNNIFIAGESGGDNIPITHKLVLKTIFVSVKRVKSNLRLSCGVVKSEVFGLAIRDLGVTIRVFREVVPVHVDA